jgi:hypothetical protein
VFSTPPTNTSATTPKSSRRSVLLQAAGGPAIGAGLPLPAPSVAAQTIDTELIELGARFEPSVDQYNTAHRRWSGSLPAPSAERDWEFGPAKERGHLDAPEIGAAFEDSCERWGASEVSDVLSAIYKEMKPLADAINAASVTSIEGFRAKALVAFWEVAPLGAGNSEFSFEDPFQQLLKLPTFR